MEEYGAHFSDEILPALALQLAVEGELDAASLVERDMPAELTVDQLQGLLKKAYRLVIDRQYRTQRFLLKGFGIYEGEIHDLDLPLVLCFDACQLMPAPQPYREGLTFSSCRLGNLQLRRCKTLGVGLAVRDCAIAEDLWLIDSSFADNLEVSASNISRDMRIAGCNVMSSSEVLRQIAAESLPDDSAPAAAEAATNDADDSYFVLKALHVHGTLAVEETSAPLARMTNLDIRTGMEIRHCAFLALSMHGATIGGTFSVAENAARIVTLSGLHVRLGLDVRQCDFGSIEIDDAHVGAAMTLGITSLGLLRDWPVAAANAYSRMRFRDGRIGNATVFGERPPVALALLRTSVQGNLSLDFPGRVALIAETTIGRRMRIDSEQDADEQHFRDVAQPDPFIVREAIFILDCGIGENLEIGRPVGGHGVIVNGCTIRGKFRPFMGRAVGREPSGNEATEASSAANGGGPKLITVLDSSIAEDMTFDAGAASQLMPIALHVEHTTMRGLVSNRARFTGLMTDSDQASPAGLIIRDSSIESHVALRARDESDAGKTAADDCWFDGIDLTGTRIDGTLRIAARAGAGRTGIKLAKVHARRLDIDIGLGNHSSGGVSALVLDKAVVGDFADAYHGLKPDGALPERFSLSHKGFVFETISIPMHGGERDEQRFRLAWLNAGNGSSPADCRVLGGRFVKAYDAAGRKDVGDGLFIALKADAVTSDGAERTLSTLLHVTAGFGYQPAKLLASMFVALIFLATIWAGFWMERCPSACTGQDGAFVMTRAAIYPPAVPGALPPGYPAFQPVTYALDLMVPIAGLGLDDHWDVNTSLGAADGRRWSLVGAVLFAVKLINLVVGLIGSGVLLAVFGRLVLRGKDQA